MNWCYELVRLRAKTYSYLIDAGAHLGFPEGRGLNFRKRANQYETKKTPNISHTSLITFQWIKPNLFVIV